jgi:hypothetical protein
MLKTFAKMAKKIPNLVTLTFDKRVAFVESVLTKRPGYGVTIWAVCYK